MKTHLLATAALALSVLVAVPASAQVSGIAIADPAIALASSQARQTADAQIATTFQAQRTQLEQLQQQRATALRQFDTDGDGQLNEAEQTAAQSNTAAIQQIQTLEETISQTQGPITQARMYALEQVLQQFNPAMQQVVQQKSIQLILSPADAIFASDAVDVTDEIITALNTLVPSVSTSVPAGWQPQRQTAQLFQEVQQLLLQAAVQQQQQQQAAGAAQQQPVQGR
jgi:Skp family chaperone for outer membrane proteins